MNAIIKEPEGEDLTDPVVKMDDPDEELYKAIALTVAEVLARDRELATKVK